MLEQIVWHRTGLLLRGKLNDHKALLPNNFVTSLDRYNSRAILKSLNAIAVLQGIQQQFTIHNIQFLVFKGLVLSNQIYGSAVARNAKDIDILVHADDVANVHKLFIKMGYRQSKPDCIPGTAAFDQYMIHQKDAVFISPEQGTEIEIHWRLDKNPKSYPYTFNRLWEHRSEVNLRGLTIPTFGSQDNCLYLAMHGGISMWGRLRWLYDWHALLNSKGLGHGVQLDWYQIKIQAEQLGLTRMVSIAMILVRDLFKSELPVPYNNLHTDWYARRVASLIKVNLEKMQYPPRWQRVVARLCLKPGAAYKLSYLTTIVKSLDKS